MAEEKILYIWFEGQLKIPPQIHVKAEVEMPLPEFRDRYVDTSQSHLIVRVYSAKDSRGQTYKIALQEVDEAAPEPETVKPAEKLVGTSLTAIKGIGRKTAARFQQKTVAASVETLLQAGTTSQGRTELARQSGKAIHLISQWVQLADLMRVEGIGEDYSALLWHAGVTSIPELKQQTPEALAVILENFNQRRKIVNRLPSAEQLKSWVAQAQTLPPVVRK